MPHSDFFRSHLSAEKFDEKSKKLALLQEIKNKLQEFPSDNIITPDFFNTTQWIEKYSAAIRTTMVPLLDLDIVSLSRLGQILVLIDLVNDNSKSIIEHPLLREPVSVVHIVAAVTNLIATNSKPNLSKERQEQYDRFITKTLKIISHPSVAKLDDKRLKEIYQLVSIANRLLVPNPAQLTENEKLSLQQEISKKKDMYKYPILGFLALALYATCSALAGVAPILILVAAVAIGAGLGLTYKSVTRNDSDLSHELQSLCLSSSDPSADNVQRYGLAFNQGL